MKRKNENGFTLIELLIAVFILTVVLLAICSMVYSVMRSTSTSKETSIATALMQQKMEFLRNTASATPGTWSETVPMGNINYIRTWSVTPTSPPSNYRTITLTVNWTDRGPHSVAATTLRAD